MSLLAVGLAWSSLRPADGSSSGQTAALSTEPIDTPMDQPLPGGAAISTTPAEALKQLIISKTPRDPFASREAQATASAEPAEQVPDLLDTLRLTGVLTQNGVTFLLINDRVAQVGETIGRLKIESANQDGVWLTHWKGRDFLEVGKSFVLKTPARMQLPASTP
ncbi:MAG: hypothetical protein QM715_02600 [Nibricoccus sp.]